MAYPPRVIVRREDICQSQFVQERCNTFELYTTAAEAEKCAEHLSAKNHKHYYVDSYKVDVGDGRSRSKIICATVLKGKKK